MAAEAERPAASAGSPPTADPQDPLPESNWKFRRWFTFLGEAATGGLLVYVLIVLAQMGTTALGAAGTPPQRAVEVAVEVIHSLFKIGIALVIRSGLSLLLYLVAPSAEQAAKWMASLSAWKGGISTFTRSSASSAEGSASTSTTTGPAAVAAPSPPAPPAGPRVSGQDTRVPPADPE